MEMGNTLRKSLSEVNSSIDTTQGKGWRKLLAFLGPAYLVSVGYMDPGNWATDIAGGSRFGYALIWVLLMSNLMALLLQSLSARLGIVRQLDLAQASRSTYNRGVNFCLWILAEIAIAACDLAEVLGMAIGLQLLFDLPLLWGVSLTVLDTLLLLFLQSYGIRKIEAFIIALVAIIGGAFLIEMFLAKPNFGELAKGFIPSIPNDQALVYRHWYHRRYCDASQSLLAFLAGANQADSTYGPGNLDIDKIQLHRFRRCLKCCFFCQCSDSRVSGFHIF